MTTARDGSIVTVLGWTLLQIRTQSGSVVNVLERMPE